MSVLFYNFKVLKSILMLKSVFLVIFIVLAIILNGQNFSRIGVNLGEEGMKSLSNNNISAIHGFLKKDGYFIGEFDNENIKKLSAAGLSYHYLIEDLQEYYINDRNNPKIENVNSCFPGLAYYPSVENFSLGSMAGYYTLDEVITELDNMYSLFPEIITEKVQIGTSVSIEGRPIYWLKISDNPNDNEDEPQVLYTAIHHSQEPASIHQLIHFMYYLLENYETNPEVQYLIDNTEMYFIPIVNPDGYVYNEQENPDGGGMWRKNRRENDGLLSGYGVDLNRNYEYAFAWDNIGSGSFGQHPWYRGEYAFSEPETQATKYFLENHNILLALNWHTYGDMLIYPWNYENHLTADSLFYEILSEEMTIENHYRYGTCYETYGYQSNGDADDWGYGETDSKNKIISLTGEAGNMDDGFWPDESRIEDICRNTLRMNLAMAHLALPFARFTDMESYIIDSPNGHLNFKLHCVGLSYPANFTVNFEALSNNISFNENSVSFSNMEHMEITNGSINYQINAEPGDFVNYIVSINNGLYSFNDTITKVFGYTEQLFYDNCESLDNWNADDWGVTNLNPYEGAGCLNESPNSNYSIMQTSELEPNQSINLSGYSNAVVRFMIRYKSENNYDYLQAFISVDDGSSWQALCGRLSKIGTDDEDEGQPVYHGNLQEWTFEEFILDDYIGETVRFKFIFKSDQNHNYEGFYIDNFEVIALNPELVSINNHKSNLLKVYPSPANETIYISNNSAKILSINIFDVSGRLVKNILCEKGVTRLDISDFKSGMYFWSSVNDIYEIGKILVK
jgi:carboxypeptidase T